MESIVQSFMQILTSIKILHWQTTSYVKHLACDALHKKLFEKVDKFVEVMQAKTMRRVSFPLSGNEILLTNFSQESDLEFLKSVRIWLETTLPELLAGTDTDLLNLRDEMLSNINQAIYLFTFQ